VLFLTVIMNEERKNSPSLKTLQPELKDHICTFRCQHLSLVEAFAKAKVKLGIEIRLGHH
jgi:hypothetical protein